MRPAVLVGVPFLGRDPDAEDMKTIPLALYIYFGENVTDWGNVMAGRR